MLYKKTLSKYIAGHGCGEVWSFFRKIFDWNIEKKDITAYFAFFADPQIKFVNKSTLVYITAFWNSLEIAFVPTSIFQNLATFAANKVVILIIFSAIRDL